MYVRARRGTRAFVAALTMGMLAACGIAAPTHTPNVTAAASSSSSPDASREGDELSPIACAAMRQPVYESINPTTGRTLLTSSAKEAQNAVKYGFTDQRGEVMKAASATDIQGLVAIHRMSSTATFAWVVAGRVSSMTAHGFTDQGVNFYASPLKSSCTRPVTELTRNNVRRYTADALQYRQLVSAGWVDRGTAFYVAANPFDYGKPTEVGPIELADPDPGDKTFSFAAIPDTQVEVHSPDDQRLANRSQWLVENRQRLDLRFAVQIGDLVDWDTPDHQQYELAQRGLEPMTAAKFPYFLNIGNHDGQAVCDGGGACDARFTTQLARDTTVFNQYFKAQQLGVTVGEFEPGKIDNTYTTIGAGGLKWLMINLELWPREPVIAWAKELVKSHPDYNVIIATHAFLDENNEIDNAPNYGSTTSRQLYDQLIAPYKNVKFVLCGHVGFSGSTKALQRKDGSKVYAFMQAYHSPTTNPVRLIEVNTEQDTVTSWVTAPATNEELQKPETFSRIGLIR